MSVPVHIFQTLFFLSRYSALVLCYKIYDMNISYILKQIRPSDNCTIHLCDILTWRLTWTSRLQLTRYQLQVKANWEKRTKAPYLERLQFMNNLEISRFDLRWSWDIHENLKRLTSYFDKISDILS